MTCIVRLRQAWTVAALFACVFAPSKSTLFAQDPETLPSKDWKTALIQAEVAGDSVARTNLLRSVIQTNPELAAARWQLGEIQVDGKWQTVESTQHLAIADPRQRQYAERRARAGDSPDDQLELAQWCQRIGLPEEARFHWLTLLSIDPNFEEALRNLKMEWLGGQLLPKDRVATAKLESRRRESSYRQASSQIADWYRQMEGELAERTRVLAAVAANRDPIAAAAMESFTLSAPAKDDLSTIRHRQISHAFLDSLVGISTSAAMQSLVRQAVISPHEGVRAAAMRRLKTRSLHDYVPALLDALSMPIESQYSISSGFDGSVQYQHQFYRRGQFADAAVNLKHDFFNFDLNGQQLYSRPARGIHAVDITPTDDDVFLAARMNARRAQVGMANQALAVEQQLAAANAIISSTNERLFSVLATTTGQSYNEVADWWNWWQDYTEYYDDGITPVYSQDYSDYSYVAYRPNSHYVQPSCFVRGTLVWTKLGKRPIETIRKGDLVLAKDVDTGELSYKVVLETTVRPPSPVISLSVEGEQIGATRGHPFWIAGKGWQMAKHLASTDVLHAVQDARRVLSTQEIDKAEAYNLIVADFNTYFVGQSGLLVHDNTPVRTTASVVPGIAKTND